MSFTVKDKRGSGTRASGEDHGDEAAIREEAPPWFPVFVEFEKERIRQLNKWGVQNGLRLDGTGDTYDARAADEFKLQNDARERAGKKGIWRKILLEEVYEALAEKPGPRLFTELKEAGAVITAWMEDLISRGVVELDERGCVKEPEPDEAEAAA